MKIKAIVAVDKEFGIGKDNILPWHIPGDLQLFKQVTLNHAILMGRKTWESIGNPLPNRTNIVLSNTLEDNIEGVRVVRSLGSALTAVPEGRDLFIIGGSTIYEKFEPLVEELIITKVYETFDTDTKFPSDIYNLEENPNPKWGVMSYRTLPDCNATSFVLRRKQN